MAFGFQRKQRENPTLELRRLEKERAQLETQVEAASKLKELRDRVKEDKRTLKKLKTELHPSVYGKFGKFLVEAGKGSYHATKTGWEEYDKFHKSLNKEKATSQSRKKVLKQIS